MELPVRHRTHTMHATPQRFHHVMAGLPHALLTKWATPFDHETAKLRSFLPLGPFPEHLTEDKCLKLHAIYRDAVQQTEELEGIVASKLKELKRKRSRSSSGISNNSSSSSSNTTTATTTNNSNNTSNNNTSNIKNNNSSNNNNPVGWVEPRGEGESRNPPAKHKQQPLKKKERARVGGTGGAGGAGGIGGPGSAGDSQHNKRRKGSSGKESKRSSQQWPAWSTRTPKTGDQVAAKVEEEALWILATVEKHNEKKGVFVVVDDDAGEDKRRQFKLRRSNILTLPRPEEASGAIFPVGSRVMTLYPQTTTFYPATISGPFVEGRDGGTDFCVMQFQDDELTAEGVLPHWRLPARFVRQRN